MKKEEGLTLIALVITIIILLILAGVTLHFVLGNDGIIKKASTVEMEYNKSEVLESLNILLTEKYLEAYNESAGKDIQNYYNEEIVINYLTEKGYIEKLKDTSDAEVENKYYIHIDQLQRNITKYGLGKNGAEGNGKDLFFVEKTDTAYVIKYVPSKGDIEVIGNLEMQQQL